MMVWIIVLFGVSAVMWAANSGVERALRDAKSKSSKIELEQGDFPYSSRYIDGDVRPL